MPFYANLDQFYFNKHVLTNRDLTQSDRWIISRSHTLIKMVTEAYDHYEPTPVARMIQDFVIDDLSNWYVRLNRKRLLEKPTGSGQRSCLSDPISLSYNGC